jgi:hypothetical protein
MTRNFPGMDSGVMSPYLVLHTKSSFFKQSVTPLYLFGGVQFGAWTATCYRGNRTRANEVY